MHEELFHSPERPFRATPDSRFYFAHDSIESARQTIVRAVLRAEGPVMVLGGAGLGKSLLGMVVAADLSARFDIVQLHAARLCSRRALLQSILFELHLPYRDLSEGDLRLSILARLEPGNGHAPEGVLFIIDEADTLPAKLLDELRLITNFTRGNQPRARMVLIGNLRLEHTFAEPQMESFNQRLAARCYLQPMNRAQTREYVQHQLSVAGFKSKELITEDAINAVYSASEGVPRLTNQIMDHALALAITGSQCPVSSSLVEEAWADLQQLPAPWHHGADRLAVAPSTVNSSTTSNSVEFGALEDDDDWGASIEPARAHQPQRPKSTPTTFSSEDSDGDLRLADEPQETNITPRKNNFFAAFVPPEESNIASYADSFDNDSTELDLAPVGLSNGSTNLEQPTAVPTVKPASQIEVLVRPRVVFDASQAFRFANTNEEERRSFDPTGESQVQDSFFLNRPTDEQMLAFEDEQQTYDAMGLWENDPPLAIHREEAVDVPQPGQVISQASRELFGDDFEEEVSLSSSAASPISLGRIDIAQTAAAPQSTTSAQQAAEAADYIGRIQQFADSMVASNRLAPDQMPPTVDEVLAEAESAWDDNVLSQLSGAAALDTWTMNVATMDPRDEIEIQDEIEDMVSQLNFAAFSVEPFSVEQISIEPRDQTGLPPRDSSRNGKNDEIYTLHRPLDRTDFGLDAIDLQSRSADDDRDLLVIEEELSAGSKLADDGQRAVTKMAPYSQLFAKLRK